MNRRKEVKQTPKLKKTECEKKLDFMPRLIRSKAELIGIKNLDALAARVGISHSTMYKRLRDPGGITFLEMI